MSQRNAKITVRQTIREDVLILCEILNEIIGIGGTTALETPLCQSEFRKYFLQGENHICCFSALDESGFLAGFQAMERHPKLPNDWADIATFSRVQPKTRGIGSALFDKTKLYAKQSGITAINATIRSDNVGGLTYYKKMGFETYSVRKAVLLKNGDKVDRISKQFYVNGL